MATIDGLKFVVSPLLEDREVGYWITPLRTHWLVARVLGLFGKSDFVGWVRDEMPREPEFFMMDGRIVTSPLGMEKFTTQLALKSTSLGGERKMSEKETE